MEELLCLLHHARLQECLQGLDGESARIASLQFADPHEQQQALTGLRHRAEAELDNFYFRAPIETNLDGKDHDKAE